MTDTAAGLGTLEGPTSHTAMRKHTNEPLHSEQPFSCGRKGAQMYHGMSHMELHTAASYEIQDTTTAVRDRE